MFYYLQHHIFKDNNSRFQLFNQETEKEFLNIDFIEATQNISTNDNFFKMSIFLSSKQIIHDRKVYSFMNFLEGLGGIQAAWMSIGIFLHFIISGND